VAQYLSQGRKLNEQILTDYACNVLLGAAADKGWMDMEKAIRERVKGILSHV
jgi:hypothetical protein